MSGSSSISTSRSSSPGPGGGGYVRTADDQTGRLCIPGQEDEINQNLINQENSLNGHIAPRSSHSYSMQNQGYAQRREPMPDRFGGGGGGGGGYGGGPGRGGYDRFGGGPGRREEDMFPEPDPDKLVEDIYSTVQIKNLSRNVTEEHIKEVFSSFGKILCIDYPVEIRAGFSRMNRWAKSRMKPKNRPRFISKSPLFSCPKILWCYCPPRLCLCGCR